MGIQWRKNVLLLVGFGYLTVIIVFLAIVMFSGGTASVKEAYTMVSPALMALIGGSLAISKDLINSDDESHMSSMKDGLRSSDGDADASRD